MRIRACWSLYSQISQRKHTMLWICPFTSLYRCSLLTLVYYLLPANTFLRWASSVTVVTLWVNDSCFQTTTSVSADLDRTWSFRLSLLRRWKTFWLPYSWRSCFFAGGMPLDIWGKRLCVTSCRKCIWILRGQRTFYNALPCLQWIQESGRPRSPWLPSSWCVLSITGLLAMIVFFKLDTNIIAPRLSD